MIENLFLTTADVALRWAGDAIRGAGALVARFDRGRKEFGRRVFLAKMSLRERRRVLYANPDVALGYAEAVRQFRDSREGVAAG